MSDQTLGILEKLRPPVGFRTRAVLGATYSLDLLTCMAVLTTLDGGEGEQIRYGRVEAYRALDRLRGRVLIAHQAERISARDGEKYPSLALLDRFLVSIRLPAHGSFHPKVWIVRQADVENRERYVLLVSSRNITTSTDWDLGVAVEGSTDRDGVEFPRLADFSRYCHRMAGRETEALGLGDLASVRWKLPAGVRELDFDFQEGTDGPRRLHDEWNRFDKKASRVLLLSPFIDPSMVKEAGSRWGGIKTRLVAGREGLLTVSVGAEREALRSLQPRQLAAATEMAESAEADGEDEGEEEAEYVRALHAKVIAVDDGRRATVVLGSNNLTSSGWRGGSTEAFVRITGGIELVEPLWEWSSTQAEMFEFPPAGTPPPDKPVLEKARDLLNGLRFRLEDSTGAEPSRLSVVDGVVPAMPEGVVLTVARYTQPRHVVPFPSGAKGLELLHCDVSQRTRFIVCTLSHLEETSAWITDADLTPPIDDLRDTKLVARLLGLKEFLAYLQSLQSDVVIAGTVEGDSEDPVGSQLGSRHSEVFDGIHLEGLLRNLVSSPDAFAEMDKAVVRYGELIRKGQLEASELELLERFLGAWQAIRGAWHP